MCDDHQFTLSDDEVLDAVKTFFVNQGVSSDDLESMNVQNLAEIELKATIAGANVISFVAQEARSVIRQKHLREERKDLDGLAKEEI